MAKQRESQKTPAILAREAAGLTVEQAAKQARICTAYLKAVERRGGASFVLATRLSRLYQCSMNVFLYSKPKKNTEASE